MHIDETAPFLRNRSICWDGNLLSQDIINLCEQRYSLMDYCNKRFPVTNVSRCLGCYRYVREYEVVLQKRNSNAAVLIRFLLTKLHNLFKLKELGIIGNFLSYSSIWYSFCYGYIERTIFLNGGYKLYEKKNDAAFVGFCCVVCAHGYKRRQ